MGFKYYSSIMFHPGPILRAAPIAPLSKALIAADRSGEMLVMIDVAALE